MRWTDIQWSPPARTLRQFAALWLVCSVAAALSLGWGAALPGVVGVAGLVWPTAIRPVFAAATALTFPVGWLVSQVVLVALYFGVFTPMGLLMRLARRDALALCYRPAAPTYWQPRRPPADVRRYFRQF
jgi:hypothetical protein